MDNNRTEQEMKRIALGRKNFLFVGSPRGGQTAAILASMTSTCRRQKINPQLYLTQLLANLPTTPKDQLGPWMPDALCVYAVYIFPPCSQSGMLMPGWWCVGKNT